MSHVTKMEDKRVAEADCLPAGQRSQRKIRYISNKYPVLSASGTLFNRRISSDCVAAAGLRGCAQRSEP